MIISLDTETTGVDLAHGAMPFLVTTCDDAGRLWFWEWDVDPLTRQPTIPSEDVRAIRERIDGADLVYMQNGKFDARALKKIGIDLPWAKVRDTLVMGHLLASNHPHNLTDMCIEYLGVDIEPHELFVKGVVKTCRTICRKYLPRWMIAKEDQEGMPSVRGSSSRDEDQPWKNDMWLPRALIVEGMRTKQLLDPSLRPGSPWQTACAKYANTDAEATLNLGLEMESLIRQRGLWEIYVHRLEVMRMACQMEEYGVSVVGDYTETTIREYEVCAAEMGDTLASIAADHGHELELARGASINDNMRDFIYGAKWQECPRCNYRKRVKHWTGDDDARTSDQCPKCAKPKRGRAGANVRLSLKGQPNLGLPVIGRAHGGSKKAVVASLDKETMAEYLATADGDALDFIRTLLDKRKRDTDLTYMEAYRRYWVPIPGSPGYYRIYPGLNPFGTDHLRWASSNPNLQNVGKQEDECEECEGKGGDCAACRGTGKSRLSVRYCFGPAPGREWWSMDFQNIELRIPAYESGEEAMVELFERPDDPPYFGSYHCLNASIVYPDLFAPLADKRDAFKKKYKSTEYQWAKNGGFAMQYGCGESKADRTFRRAGAYRKLKEKLPKIAALSARYIASAEKTGYVETLPDRGVDPKRGYPILASRTDDGRVMPTTPLNYHVSGTACWIKNRALLKCDAKLAEWRRGGFDGHISLEIHDEIIFDFPRGATMQENLPRAMELKKLMESCGDDLIPRIPSPVSVEYHTKTWAKGTSV